VKAREITIKGPRGTLVKNLRHLDVEIAQISKKKLQVRVWHGKRKHIACIRTVASHIENMIVGVTRVSMLSYDYTVNISYLFIR
jgi:large subunit ribosomal protein L9e